MTRTYPLIGLEWLILEKQEDVFEIVQAGCLTKAGQRIACEDAAFVDDRNAVTKFFRLAHDMRGKDNRAAIVAQFADRVLIGLEWLILLTLGD